MDQTDGTDGRWNVSRKGAIFLFFGGSGMLLLNRIRWKHEPGKIVLVRQNEANRPDLRESGHFVSVVKKMR